MEASTQVMEGAAPEFGREDGEERGPTLLLATDGSNSSRLAAGRAAGLARQTGGALLALYVVDVGLALGKGAAWCHTLRALIETGRRATDDAKAIAEEHGVACETLLADGKPAWTIAELAERVGADYVLVGAGSGRDGERLGGVAGEVVRRCCRPVLVVGGGTPSGSRRRPFRIEPDVRRNESGR